jgi:hypothetical protein
MLVLLLLLVLASCSAARRADRPEPIGRPVAHTDIQRGPAPIAEPVPPEATLRSHVRVVVRPLGEVEYNGQVLPLTSPDGRFVATQVGAAPSWEALLAAPGALPPAGSRIVIYEIRDGSVTERGQGADAAPPQIRRAREVAVAALLLGRSCDDRGFLVESPRPDGARWIGFVSWEDARVAWLVQGDAVNAHAVLGPGGEMAYVRRETRETATELVFLPRGRAGELVWSAAEGDVSMPMFDAGGEVRTFVVSERGIELVALLLGEEGLAAGARLLLATSASPLWAYQATAPMRSAIANAGRGVTFFHPRQRRMVTWVAHEGRLVRWVADSIACSFADGGAFLTTPGGLVYQRWDENRTDPDPNVVRVLAGVGVARGTADRKRASVLAPAERESGYLLKMLQVQVDGGEGLPPGSGR